MIRDPLLAAFESLVRRSPERTLVTSGAKSSRVTEIDASSRQLAVRVRDAVLPEDSLVALAAPNGPAFLAGLLALRRAGFGAALLDPTAPEPEARRVAQALGATALLSCATAWPDSAGRWSLSALDQCQPFRRPGSPVVKVTSGSTGAARGVLASIESLLADEEALCRSMGLRDTERIVAAIPFSHSYGLSSVVLPALVRGSLLLVPDGTSPLAPLEAARGSSGSFFPTAPAYLHALVRLGRPEAWPASLRLVVSAGAVLPAETARSFREIYGQPLHSFYGASECGGICYDRTGEAAERGTVGEPVAGVRVDLAPLPEGSASSEGMVVVESTAVAVGYLPFPDPRLGGGRFHASDRAIWRGGELELRGRCDSVINVKGRKVDPAEVERVLRSIDGVLEAVVVGAPAASGGGESVRAFVTCGSARLTPHDVLAHCRKYLASHKVPRSVRIVGDLPRNARGKVDRQKLLLDESEVQA